MSNSLQVKLLAPDGVLPSKNEGDAGFDLTSVEDYILRPLERHLFKTHISVAIPSGYYGQICDRSGNAYKKGLHVLAGIIDSTFIGEIGIVLVNLDSTYVRIEKGDRIAQIVIQPYWSGPVLEVAELETTTRGAAGFGSSGR